MGDVLGIDVNGNQCLRGGVRDIVDGDDVWSWCEPYLGQRSLDGCRAADVVRTTVGRES